MSQIERNEKGQVAPGSGAQLGATSTRRLGTGRSSRLAGLIEPEVEAIVKALIDTAKGSTKEAVRAAEAALDRWAAKPRPTAELVHIPAMKDAKTLPEKVEAVLAALADGQVSADAARAVLQTIDAAGRVMSATKLEKRLQAIEERLLGRQRTEPDPESLV